MQINNLSMIAYRSASEKGWHDTPRSIPELLCLIHSELSEALEEYRSGNPPDHIYYNLDKNDNVKPEGLPIEIADAVIRIADFCGLHEIDLEKAINIKLEYNKKRSYRHGDKRC